MIHDIPSPVDPSSKSGAFDHLISRLGLQLAALTASALEAYWSLERVLVKSEPTCRLDATSECCSSSVVLGRAHSPWRIVPRDTDFTKLGSHHRVTLCQSKRSLYQIPSRMLILWCPTFPPPFPKISSLESAYQRTRCTVQHQQYLSTSA